MVPVGVAMKTCPTCPHARLPGETPLDRCAVLAHGGEAAFTRAHEWLTTSLLDDGVTFIDETYTPPLTDCPEHP